MYDSCADPYQPFVIIAKYGQPLPNQDIVGIGQLARQIRHPSDDHTTLVALEPTYLTTRTRGDGQVIREILLRLQRETRVPHYREDVWGFGLWDGFSDRWDRLRLRLGGAIGRRRFSGERSARGLPVAARHRQRERNEGADCHPRSHHKRRFSTITDTP